MEKICEILAGDGFSNAVTDMNLNARKQYGGRIYEVWSIAGSDYKKICDITDDDWKDEWGWWRYADGSNITDWPIRLFLVNKEQMIGYFKELDSDEISPYVKNYSSLTDYLYNEIGASAERNICAVSVDLAKLNGMTLAELFQKYQGDDLNN